jgi:hypothetical protein
MDEIDDVEVTPLDFLEAVYCNPNLPLATRLRAAIEAAPYKHPKLSAAAIGHFERKSFPEALDRCIERSKQPVPLPAPKTIEHLPAEALKKSFPNYRNNYRRY